MTGQRKYAGLIKAILLVLIAQLLLLGVLMIDGDYRLLTKRKLIDLDAKWTDGIFRRMYHAESLPTPPASPPDRIDRTYSWVSGKEFLVIAHALGPRLHSGNNTLPTLVRGLDMGFSIFEVDLALTTDNRLVCYHGASDEALTQLTYANFVEEGRREGITPCEFSNLVQVVQVRPDVMFVLDVKNRFAEAYDLISDLLETCSCGKSFIPQVYSFNQIEQIRRGDIFAGEIFTSYRSSLTTRRIFEMAERFGVRVVTLTLERYENSIGQFPSSLFVFTHPVDDPFLADKVRRTGGRGIYTSYISPSTMPEVFDSTYRLSPFPP